MNVCIYSRFIDDFFFLFSLCALEPLLWFVLVGDLNIGFLDYNHFLSKFFASLSWFYFYFCFVQRGYLFLQLFYTTILDINMAFLSSNSSCGMLAGKWSFQAPACFWTWIGASFFLPLAFSYASISLGPCWIGTIWWIALSLYLSLSEPSFMCVCFPLSIHCGIVLLIGISKRWRPSLLGRPDERR